MIPVTGNQCAAMANLEGKDEAKITLDQKGQNLAVQLKRLIIFERSPAINRYLFAAGSVAGSGRGNQVDQGLIKIDPAIAHVTNLFGFGKRIDHVTGLGSGPRLK